MEGPAAPGRPGRSRVSRDGKEIRGMFMRTVYDEKLAQAAYLFGCQRSGEAVIIDPQRDVDRYIDLAAANELRIVAVAETHIHADFLSGARELAARVGAKVFVSDEGGPDWKYRWLDKQPDGTSYDYQLLRDGETFWIGKIEFEAIHTPGHTPEHMVFLVTDHGSGATEPMGLVSGDFLFVGDLGRPDLLETAAGQAGAMEPAAYQLHQSLERIADLPDFVQVWPGHGSGSACGKSLGAVPTSTMGYERRFNEALNAAADEAVFVPFILGGQPEPPVYFANMKRDNKAGPALLGDLPAPPKISADELAKVDAAAAAILDTRDWELFRVAHLPGSLSFPHGRSFPTDVGSMVRESEDVYLVIEQEMLEEVVRDLVRIGIDRIRGWCPPDEASEAMRSMRSSIDQVDAAEAQRLIQEGSVRVLDVRRATEYEGGHLENAVNVAHTRLAVRLHELPKEARLLVHCQRGSRSTRAAAYLKRFGFDVVNLEGGIEAWADIAAPIVV